MNPVLHAQQKKRVAALLEEVRLYPNSWELEDILPNVGDASLHPAARCGQRVAGERPMPTDLRGQFAAIELAAGQQRKFFESHERIGYHVLW